MKLEHHIAVSTIISGALYYILKSWGLAIASFFTGILIDIDRCFDYLIENRLNFNTKQFFHFFYSEKHRKITLIFHGWEWLVILGIIAKITDFNLWLPVFGLTLSI